MLVEVSILQLGYHNDIIRDIFSARPIPEHVYSPHEHSIKGSDFVNSHFWQI